MSQTEQQHPPHGKGKGQTSVPECVESLFVDDYQHYPRDQQRIQSARKDNYLTYCVSTLPKFWSEMLVEERQVNLTN